MATLTETQPAQQNGPSSYGFTCNTCQVAFRTHDAQRTHMQSDWHRYNLKRRVASLPPLTSEIFAEKVIANRATAEATAARSTFQRMCEACDKIYYSEGAYVNHLGSQKHRILTARLNARAGNDTESLVDSTFSLGSPMENASTSTGSTIGGTFEDVKAEAEFDNVVEKIKTTGLDDALADVEDPLSSRPSRATPATAQYQKDHPLSARSPDHLADANEVGELEHKADLTQCLFCNYLSPTLDLNLHHMSRQHGFFVPEREYLVNLEGLINYISETIQVLNTCLYCHKSLHTASGIQTHMRDRGHCMLAYQTEDEQMDVGEFYDFRSTYSDEETEGDEDEEVNGGVSLGAKRGVKTTHNVNGEDVEMADGAEDDEGWESDSTLSSVPTDEITSVPASTEHKLEKLKLSRHHSHTDPRPHKKADGFHSHAHHTPNAVYHDEYELHLPSGRTAGHRSLNTYYRQNLRNHPSAEEREQQQRMLEDGRHESDEDADDEDTETSDSRERGRQVVTRANGGMGMIGVSDAKKREIKAVEKREMKRQQRAEKRYQWGNDRRGNFQKHFRDPLLQ